MCVRHSNHVRHLWCVLRWPCMHHKPLSLLDLSENAIIWGYLGKFWGGIALEIGIRVIGQLLEKDRVQIRTLGFPAVLKEVITIWIWNLDCDQKTSCAWTRARRTRSKCLSNCIFQMKYKYKTGPWI